MKTTFTLLCAFFMASSATLFAQGNDTLLFENFDVDPIGTTVINTAPQGNDPFWVNFDSDLILAAGGSPGEWYWSEGGFADVDTTDNIFISKSWLTGFAPGNRNYLISPAIQIIDNTAVLSWESAPFQTPLYLDGYSVLVSTTDNIETSFTDTLFQAAQYLAGSGNDFSAYTFSPGFVHGLDGTYIEPGSDSTRFLGILRPFSASLAAYAGMTIYVCFLHDSDDDNLIGIDDILVKGTAPLGIADNNNAFGLEVYPNPSSEVLNLRFNLVHTSPVFAAIYDMSGKLVSVVSNSNRLAGNHQLSYDLKGLKSGMYQVLLRTKDSKEVVKFVVE